MPNEEKLAEGASPIAPRTWVNWMMDAIKGILVAAVIGIAGWVFNLQSQIHGIQVEAAKTEKDISHLKEELGKDISHLKEEVGKDVSRLEKTIDRLEAKMDKLFDKLESKIEQAVKRQAYMTDGGIDKTSHKPSYHEHVGKIGRINKEAVTIEDSSEDVKIEWTFQLADGVRVIMDGKTAKLADLKPGMMIRVFHSDRKKAELLETVDKEKEKEKGPPLLPFIPRN